MHPMIYCSQCGASLGPGAHGVSDCERHEPRLGMIKAAGPALLAALRVMLDTFADDGETPPDEAIKQAREAVNTAIGMEPDGLTLNPAAWEAIAQEVKANPPPAGMNDFSMWHLGEPFALHCRGTFIDQSPNCQVLTTTKEPSP